MHRLSALAGLLLAGCLPPEEAPQDAGRCGAADPLSASALMADVEAFADPGLKGRAAGSAGEARAAALVEERLACLGLETRQQPFSADGLSSVNVIGVLRGQHPALQREIVVIGAHLDHLGQDGNGVYRGANDNASGLAVMLGVAAALAEDPPDRTVVFIGFGAEEEGFLGSEHYVGHAPADLPLRATRFMVNLDMVGTYGDQGGVNALHALPGTPGRAVLDGLVGEFPELDVFLGEPGADSDHLLFCEAGIPTTFFFTEDTRCYHQTCDTPDHLDAQGMAGIARLVAAFAEALADGDQSLDGPSGCER